MGRVKSSHPRMFRILVPLDFSGKSRQALRFAVPIAQKFAARIALLHVLAPATGRAARAADAAVVRNRQEQAAARRLDDMATTLLPRGTHAQNVVAFGRAADVILNTARRLDVDMIVLTTRGEGGLKRLILGSTAEQVMRRSVCPVLSVRRH